MTHVEPMDRNEAFAELGPIRLADVDIDTLLDKIAQLAKRTIPSAADVSVTLLQGGNAHTAAFTGELARKLDEIQYERGHGPCLDASEGTASLSVPDTSSEQRWPDWARNAQQAGAHSSLSIVPGNVVAGAGDRAYEQRVGDRARLTAEHVRRRPCRRRCPGPAGSS